MQRIIVFYTICRLRDNVSSTYMYHTYETWKVKANKYYLNTACKLYNFLKQSAVWVCNNLKILRLCRWNKFPYCMEHTYSTKFPAFRYFIRLLFSAIEYFVLLFFLAFEYFMWLLFFSLLDNSFVLFRAIWYFLLLLISSSLVKSIILSYSNNTNIIF